MAFRPDGAVLAGRLRNEGVVRRDRPVGVDAQDLAEVRGQAVRDGDAPTVIADRHVELAVGTELEHSTRVDPVGVERVHRVEDPLGGGVGTQAVRPDHKPADHAVDRGCRPVVVDVHVPVRGVGRVEGDAEHAAVRRARHVQAEVGGCADRATVEDLDLAGLLRDDDVALGGERHEGRREDAAVGDHRCDETCRRCRGRRAQRRSRRGVHRRSGHDDRQSGCERDERLTHVPHDFDSNRRAKVRYQRCNGRRIDGERSRAHGPSCESCGPAHGPARREGDDEPGVSCPMPSGGTVWWSRRWSKSAGQLVAIARRFWWPTALITSLTARGLIALTM